MTKYETINNINRHFDNSRNELMQFLSYVKTGDIKYPIKEYLEKSLILLLYAHWESFIKNSTNNYLTYVVLQNKQLIELTDNFHLIHIKNIMKNYKITRNLKKEEELFENLNNKKLRFKLITKKSDSSNLNYKKLNELYKFYEEYILTVNSNLRSKNYKNICYLVNYDFKDVFVKIEMNIEKLIINRNTIAHEANMVHHIDIEDINMMFGIILDEMERFRSHIIDTINNEKYLKNPPMHK